MHGGGTKLENTTPEEHTRLLDITRLASRAGRRATGIDRVELAYLNRFLEEEVPTFFIVGTTFGYLLLDRMGGRIFRDAFITGKWGGRSFFSSLFRKQTKEQQAALTLLRKYRVDFTAHSGIGKMLIRNFMPGMSYYNVGHSNYRRPLFESLKNGVQARLHLMIHDVIPIEFPEFHEPKQVDRFRLKVALASEYADRVICVSAAAKESIKTALSAFGDVPNTVHAHIGIEKMEPRYAAFPNEVNLKRPFFVCVGTVEPRKNHDLLLSAWEGMPEDGPQLVICGARGWLNSSVFQRLDESGDSIIELSGLSDETVAALIVESKGLLCPSLAEGFGLPPVEAAALGVSVFCSDLPVFYEVLGNAAVYLPISSHYAWTQALTAAAESSANEVHEEKFVPPNWDEHFKVVLG